MQYSNSKLFLQDSIHKESPDPDGRKLNHDNQGSMPLPANDFYILISRRVTNPHRKPHSESHHYHRLSNKPLVS